MNNNYLHAPSHLPQIQTDLKLKDLELTKLRQANCRILDTVEKDVISREAALTRKHERVINVLVGEQNKKVEEMGMTIVKLQKENVRLRRRVEMLEGANVAAAIGNEDLEKEKMEITEKEKKV